MQQEFSRTPPFCSMVRASGLGEVWTHANDDSKFSQFGWRCTTKENCYGNDTLVGNWNEQRFDIRSQSRPDPLPSQFQHYFDTTNAASYNRGPTQVPPVLKHLSARHSHAYPGHQPELDSPSEKAVYHSWETTTRAAYIPPAARRAPMDPDPRPAPMDPASAPRPAPMDPAPAPASAPRPAPGNPAPTHG